MKTIIKGLSEEKALNGFVLCLSNGEKFFVSKAQLENNVPLVSSEIRYLIENTSDGRRFKTCFIDNIKLVHDPDYPFVNFEEAIAYASLPMLFRHIVAAIKTQNLQSKIFPTVSITFLIKLAWMTSQARNANTVSPSEIDIKISQEFIYMNEEINSKDLKDLIDELSTRMCLDANLLDKDNFYLHASCTADFFEKRDDINFDLFKYRALIGEA